MFSPSTPALHRLLSPGSVSGVPPSQSAAFLLIPLTCVPPPAPHPLISSVCTWVQPLVSSLSNHLLCSSDPAVHFSRSCGLFWLNALQQICRPAVSFIRVRPPPVSLSLSVFLLSWHWLVLPRVNTAVWGLARWIWGISWSHNQANWAASQGNASKAVATSTSCEINLHVFYISLLIFKMFTEEVTF